MGHDESAAIGSCLRKPQHRADCSDFYCNPDDEELVFRASPDIRDALEDAAQQAGRTWNEQFIYAIEVCRGANVSPGDERTATDWRTLLADMTMCLDGEWIPFRAIFPDMSKEFTH